MRWKTFGAALALSLMAGLGSSSASGERVAPQVTSPRIYALDCGGLTNNTPERFNLKREEVSNTLMSDMCFLVVHPKGTLLWDTGIPDRFTGRPLGENQSSQYVAYIRMRSLTSQLLEIGYKPEDIKYLALSHAHWDHSGNANEFARTATWLVSQKERDFMFGPNGLERGRSFWDQLKDAKTTIIPDDYDVFGDGTVVLKHTPGHTPGHLVAVVKLAHTGPVILGGDLYHYNEEITLNRMPDAEKTTETPQSRAMVIALAKKLNAQIWIAHDMALSLRLNFEPAFYD